MFILVKDSESLLDPVINDSRGQQLVLVYSGLHQRFEEFPDNLQVVGSILQFSLEVHSEHLHKVEPAEAQQSVHQRLSQFRVSLQPQKTQAEPLVVLEKPLATISVQVILHAFQHQFLQQVATPHRHFYVFTYQPRYYYLHEQYQTLFLRIQNKQFHYFTCGFVTVLVEPEHWFKLVLHSFY